MTLTPKNSGGIEVITGSMFSGKTEELIRRTTPEEMSGRSFDSGSMGPKVEAASAFVRRTGERAVIGSLSEISGMVEGTSGTQFVIE